MCVLLVCQQREALKLDARKHVQISCTMPPPDWPTCCAEGGQEEQGDIATAHAAESVAAALRETGLERQQREAAEASAAHLEVCTGQHLCCTP